MAIVNITIAERISSAPAGVILVCNNPTDTIEFAFDDEWSAYEVKTARFSWANNFIDVPFSGWSVKVPEITNTQYVFVGVYANGIASTPIKLDCKRSILCLGDHEYVPPEHTYWDEFAETLEALNKAAEGANDAVGEAEKVVEALTVFGNEATAAEAERVEAEKQRVETFAGFEGEINQLSGDIMNLEKATTGNKVLVSSKADFTNAKTYDVNGVEYELVLREGTELIACHNFFKIGYKLYCLADATKQMNHISFFDSDMNYISGVCAGASKIVEGEVDVPGNAHYVQGVWFGNMSDEPYMIGYFDGENFGNTKLEKSKAYRDGAIPIFKGIYAEDSGIYTETANLFNVFNVTKGKTFSGDGKTILDRASASICEDYIPVSKNEFWVNREAMVFAYDSDKNYIGARQFSANDSVYQITIASGKSVAYVRIKVELVDDAELQSVCVFNQRQKPQSKKSHRIIPFEHVGSRKTWFHGKKVVTLGDSITESGKWQIHLSNVLSCNIVNCGIGGTKVSGATDNAMWQDARINQIPLDADVVLIMGGSNDWASNTTLGTLSSTDTNTFHGAYITMLHKIYNHVPNAKIVLLTQPHRFNEDAEFDLPLNDFRKAVEDIADHYGYPVIKTHRVGINDWNYTVYLADAVHPNDLGAELIANAVYHGLLDLEPIYNW